MGQEEVAKAILTWAQKKMEDDDSTEKDIWKDAMRGIHNRSRKSLGFASKISGLTRCRERDLNCRILY